MAIVDITAPPEAGRDLARRLVGKELVARVNSLDCQSIYRQDGEIDDEGSLPAKTTDQ